MVESDPFQQAELASLRHQVRMLNVGESFGWVVPENQLSVLQRQIDAIQRSYALRGQKIISSTENRGGLHTFKFKKIQCTEGL